MAAAAEGERFFDALEGEQTVGCRCSVAGWEGRCDLTASAERLWLVLPPALGGDGDDGVAAGDGGPRRCALHRIVTAAELRLIDAPATWAGDGGGGGKGGQELQLTLELGRPLGPPPLDGQRLVAHGALADAAAFEALQMQLGRGGAQLRLPDWAAYIPQRLYSARLRRWGEVSMGLYTLGSVLWAGWQLYNNSALLRQAVEPAVRQLRLRLAVLVRLADRLFRLGSGVVWPIWLLLAHLLRPVSAALLPCGRLLGGLGAALARALPGAAGAGALRRASTAASAAAAVGQSE